MELERKKRVLKSAEAKAEFLALKEVVDNKLRAGFSVRAVYNFLKLQGDDFAMSYSTLKRYIQRSSSRDVLTWRRT